MRPFDTLQTSVSIADQEAIDLTLPLAQRDRRMGVIAKRPIANVAWRYATSRPESYYEDYWCGCKKLDYPFLREPRTRRWAPRCASRSRCRACTPRSSGTTKPERWEQNAALLAAGPLPAREMDRIRARWARGRRGSWVGSAVKIDLLLVPMGARYREMPGTRGVAARGIGLRRHLDVG